MNRTFTILAIAVVVLLGAGLGAAAGYQLGVTTAIHTAVTESGATVVSPVAPAWGYGYGWGGPGFGVFGFLGVLLFIFLVFALLRAAFVGGGRRGWGGAGSGGHGWAGPGDPHSERWAGRAQEAFDEFHRRAHEPDATGRSG